MTTFERVQAAIARHSVVGVEAVTETANLADDLGIDSLDMVGIAIELEGELDIDISDELIESAFTVGDIVKAVEGLLA
jgi:acyl carrier protein